jgi:hypothetical protein
MPDVYKLKQHAAKERARRAGLSRVQKMKEHADNFRKSAPFTAPPSAPYVPAAVALADYSPPYAPAAALADYSPPYAPAANLANYSPPYAPAANLADYSPPYAPDYSPSYVPDSPQYAPAPRSPRRSPRRGILRRSPTRRRGQRRISHAHTRDEQEYEIEDEVDDEGNVYERKFKRNASFRSGENPTLMKTRTRRVVGEDASASARHVSTVQRLQSEHGPCVDDRAREELVRVLDMIHGVEATIHTHREALNSSFVDIDMDEVDVFQDMYDDLDDLIRKKNELFERCGYNPEHAFGRLRKAAKKTKSAHKKRKYMILIHLLSL